ncbi:MAG: transposase [Candidatus Heimdallarchaeota archaeon]|nr:transposase [Candidatus Heimdallarchaeota archaeon]MCK5047808.1 transposase [Candidatus Heimdallarchaeota archaeon]
MAQRTERIWLQPSFNLFQYSQLSKKLYNHANYIIKFQLEHNNHLTSFFELSNILRYHPNYCNLPAHTSQQVLKFLVKNWKAYFEALKAYKKDASKFNALPKPPNYKRNLHLLYFTANQVKIKDGFLIFPKRVGLKVKTRLTVKVKVNQARIIPKGNSFLLEIIYDREVKSLRPVNNIVAGDLGVDNLMTVVSNVAKPIIIKGTRLKSYNQWFNKEKAKLSSVYALQQPGRKHPTFGKAMDHLVDRRYKKVEDFLHKVSRLFINYCLANDIDTIVLGYNDGWKQKISIGKKNNQTFVGIPFLNLVRKIQYKAEDEGIRVVLTEESYTSKCSFLDNEPIEKHSSYAGRRVHRGLFRSANDIEINADCNGAGNIGRKVFPKTFVNGIVDTVSYPICLTV